MAITKVVSIKKRLDQRVAYALNQDKTGNEVRYYETTINCMKDNAYEQMMNTKKHFDKLNGVQGYHIIQSFAQGEGTPELIHKIGVELAEKCFGDKYEVVVGTHLDKHHLHNHVMLNSVSFIDGKKYRNNFKDYYGTIRNTNDELCSKYGLSTIKKTDAPKSMTYMEWRARQTGATTYQSMIRADINECIKLAFNFGNFLYLMECKGYEIKQGKYISFKPYDGKHFSRGYKLGSKYSFNRIRNRIAGKDFGAEIINLQNEEKRRKPYIPYEKPKKGSFKALCLHYEYLLGHFKNKTAPQEIEPSKDDLKRLEEFMASSEFIKKHDFQSVEDVEKYKKKYYTEINYLKGNQTKIKDEYKEYLPLFKALQDYKFNEKAHILFTQGYDEMHHEHEDFLRVDNIIDNSDFSIAKLEAMYSQYQENLSDVNAQIQLSKKEIKLSKQALKYHLHAEKRINEIEHDINRQHMEEPMSARDMARRLNER